MKRSHTAVRDVVLHDIVSSLTENLVHFYPKETNHPPLAVLDNWSRAAAQYAAASAAAADGLTVVAGSDNLKTNDDLVQEAMKLAMENWKKQISLNPTTQGDEPMMDAAPTSFSLLDQFASSGGLLGAAAAAFFVWDNVRELQPSEQIKALQRVQYLEDVIPDWHQVQVHLQQGLVCCVDFIADDNNKSLLSDEYLELHRKWFSWSRKSNEPETAQLSIDLMVNVFQALTPSPPSSLQVTAAAASAPTTGNEAKMKRIMKLWWEMWMDIMIRGGGGGGPPRGGGGSSGGDLRLTSIVQTIWNWIPSLPNKDEQNMQSSLSERDGLLFHQLMEIDPCAKWAYSWARIHPSWTASSIVLQAMNVSVLVPWVCHYYRDGSATTMGQQQQQQPQDHDDNSCFFICVLSLLRSILVSCRVAQFPWHLFEERSSSLGLQRSDVMLALQNLFLQGLSQGQPESDNIRICIEGLEVLLSGCHGDKALFTKLVGNVESFIADNRRRDEAREALQEILERHLF